MNRDVRTAAIESISEDLYAARALLRANWTCGLIYQYCWIETHAWERKSYQVEIILYKIFLESLHRKCPLPHSFNEVMFDELFPRTLDVWTVHDVLKETTSVKMISRAFEGRNFCILVLRCKWHSINRVEMVNWPTALTQVHAGSDTCLDEPHGTANGSYHVLTHG